MPSAPALPWEPLPRSSYTNAALTTLSSQRFQFPAPSFTRWPQHIGWCFRLWNRCRWCPQHVLLLSLLAAENQTQEDSPKRRTDGDAGCAAAPNRDIYLLKLLERVVPHPQLSAASLPGKTTPQVLVVRVLLHPECIWTKAVPTFGSRDYAASLTALRLYFCSQRKDQSRKSHKCNSEAVQGWVSSPLLHKCSLWEVYLPFLQVPTHAATEAVMEGLSR